MDITQILNGAAEVVAERGLIRGEYMPFKADPATCSVCTLGAINVAAGYRPDGREPFADEIVGEAYEAAEVFHAWLIDNRPDETDDFDLLDADVIQDVGIRWNDDPQRTPEQVIAALRECAAEQAGRPA